MAFRLAPLHRNPVTATVALTVAGTTGWAFWTESRAQGELPQRYSWDALHQYWACRPFSAVRRGCEIAITLTPLGAQVLWDYTFPSKLGVSKSQERLHEQAVACKHALTQLGPAFVKAGQQLSIRPDLVPEVVLKELQTLCDAVQPIPDEICLQALDDEVGLALFTDTPVHVASASLGQVYKATLRETNQPVAIKVQRPGMLESFSLDLYLLQRLGVFIDQVAAIFTNQPPFHQALYESFAAGSYAELDYEHEASQQTLFREQLANFPVRIPKVFHATRTVLTTEWMEGIRLSDADADTIRRLIPVGVELFVMQLLETGHFHADPHVGNLLVVDGQLCLLDFGLTARIAESERAALTAAMMHLLTHDWDALVEKDSVRLGFLPAGLDTTTLKPVLTKILTAGLLEGSNLQHRKRKLQEISNELNQVFFEYPFSVPPFFALVTRGLALLEGIALTGDEDFDIFQASAPYARRRALALFGRQALLKTRNAATPKVSNT